MSGKYPVADFKRNLQAFGKKFGVRSQTIVKKVAIQIHDALVLVTPVDTGRARSNWNIALGPEPDETVNDEADWPKTPGAPSNGQGSSEGARGAAVAKGKQVILTGLPAWTPVVISNSVPYMEDLNNGTSKQAPTNFIQIELGKAVDQIEAAIDSVV